MPPPPTFDLAAAHRYFSAHCFNEAWTLIEKPDRTPDDDQRMLALSMASIYHWQERADCTAKHLSIGFWQVARIYALLNLPAESLRMAEVCMTHSRELPPFYLAYAHEALARANRLAGNDLLADEHLAAGNRLAQLIQDPKEREMLMHDLQTVVAGIIHATPSK